MLVNGIEIGNKLHPIVFFKEHIARSEMYFILQENCDDYNVSFMQIFLSSLVINISFKLFFSVKILLSSNECFDDMTLYKSITKKNPRGG